MNSITLENLRELALVAKGQIDHIYLHWSAGRYQPNDTDLADYHVLVLQDGSLLARDDMTEVLAHTWHRNTGAVGVAMACCFGATTAAFGEFPPTDQQIEAMAQVVAVLAEGLGLTIDADTVMTHAEAADLDDYGPATTCERWDLWFLKIDQARGSGGIILRGKANWYRSEAMK